MKKLFITLIVFTSLFAGTAFGNGITITNLTSVPGSGFVQLKFNLTWNNSWNNSVNHDAAWIFFKFKDNDGTWHHLNLTNTNNVIADGYSVDVPPDGTGAMIYRSVAGVGTVSLNSIMVGVQNLPGSFDVKGFALEMVQIPIQDKYYLGDGALQSNYQAGVVGGPFLVEANTISLGNTAGLLIDPLTSTSSLATGFPIAYNSGGASQSLYMMKHEISQAAYRDFLNTLTYNQQATRTGTSPSNSSRTMAMITSVLGRRSSIQIQTPGVASTTPAVYGCNLNNNGVFNEASDGEWIGCNYLIYPDVAAFLDWSALRPMSEMEFEKGCRGPLYPVLGENAAGTTLTASYTYPISNPGSANESITYSGSVLNANITYNVTSPGSNAPTRVGIHATSVSNRISAGAGYYGALDLSGNIEEFTVGTYNVAGRTFTGVNGNGELNAAGDADENFWPGINGNFNTTVANTKYNGVTGVIGQAGVITRGGSAGYTGFNLNRVSFRSFTGTYTDYPRNGISGGRGVKNW